MVTLRSDICDKCKKPNPISFAVVPEEAWKTVVLNRWRKLCPSCFDTEAEKAGVRYSFGDLDGMSWSHKPAPSKRYGRRR
jgi:hypothetical protein